MGRAFWSPSYFAASSGGAPLSVITEYLDQQNDWTSVRSALPPKA
ncbi:transposase [Nocardia pseudovaccinii]